ncbi:Hypothetical predicted protein [Olea europaea subsp. europaea]|uniref:Uncharacterized protein n=1 Tax=Olea europaea subsp. europaea TaxID=158383 RepID=A0A8S0SXT7_OLEEU|nr:Hypothetical predicted protein [Olea europaea subsp. europaea]
MTENPKLEPMGSDNLRANCEISDHLQRSLSRKGTFRGVDKKNTAKEKDVSVITTSPRVALHGGSTPEKPLIVAMGGDNNSINSPVHNQITIMNGSMGNTAIESKFGGKRFSFRQTSLSWTIDPRRILLFFATLSSLGTILLIYCTLQMSKHNGDYNAQD